MKHLETPFCMECALKKMSLLLMEARPNCWRYPLSLPILLTSSLVCNVRDCLSRFHTVSHRHFFYIRLNGKYQWGFFSVHKPHKGYDCDLLLLRCLLHLISIFHFRSFCLAMFSHSNLYNCCSRNYSELSVRQAGFQHSCTV